MGCGRLVAPGACLSLGRLVWVVVLAALVVAILATGVAVALAGAESGADLATLGAVGASPRTRRSIASAQAGVLAITGVVLGNVTGVLLGDVIVQALRHNGQFDDPTWATSVPRAWIALAAVTLPALTMGSAWLLTRSKLPMVRRIVG